LVPNQNIDAKHNARLAALASLGMIVFSCCEGGSDFAPTDPTNAVTPEGPVRGVASPQSDSVVVFKGIPYAAPPVGSLRWKPPQAPLVRAAPLRADTFAASCEVNEDCLYLDIWRPRKLPNNAPVPVLVWIHGGGLSSGASFQFDGSALASENSLVVVSINYRLSGAGFFAHPALTAEGAGSSGNYGLLDQQAAMRWVRSNIGQFGGNAKNVTVMGQSAGALSVLTQLASPQAAGLFDKAVAASGGYIRAQPTLAAAEQIGMMNAATLGCPGIDAATAACLRSLPYAITRSGLTGVAHNSWAPVIDNKILKESTASAFASGRFNKVPIIIGSNRDEFSLLASVSGPLTAETYASQVVSSAPDSGVTAAQISLEYPVADFPEPTHAYTRAMGDYRFVCGMVADANNMARNLKNVWAFELAQDNAAIYTTADRTARFPPDAAPAYFGDWGSYHTADVPYWFSQFLAADLTTTNQALSAMMRAYLSNFARTGDPNGIGLPIWTSVAASGGKTLGLASKPIPNRDSSKLHHCEFWATKAPSDRLF